LAVTRRKDLHLTVIGDGRARPEFEALAASCGIAEQTVFAGQLAAGQSMRDALDRADLFVAPSRTEGLPRAMIEAMARGLPSIGSTAGGIPELLEPEDMVPPGDADALARKILDVVDDPERLQRMSACNLHRARDYLSETLAARRGEFYQTLKRVSCPEP
jgi:glycosyltransferase involved in cell wall biosynthesis